MRAAAWLAAAVALAAGSGCSIKRYAINKLGDSLAASGATYASDDDPQLIREALPFSLKLIESLLAESPRHRGLLFAAASGFTQYSYAFVHQDADEMEERDLAVSTVLKTRARRLYLRARNYGMRGLEVRHPGLEKQLRDDPAAAAARLTRTDVPLAYWTAVSWAAAISVSKDNPDLVAAQPMVETLIDRAFNLNEDFDQGAIHSFLITYEMGRPGGETGAPARSRKRFARAMELTGGRQAGPLVSLAENVSVAAQNRKEFEELLKRAIEIDADAKPDCRLANLVAQRRARWLLGRADRLFVD
jgi:predicted anti-sigma-YlaC factor YlaD